MRVQHLADTRTRWSDCRLLLLLLLLHLRLIHSYFFLDGSNKLLPSCVWEDTPLLIVSAIPHRVTPSVPIDFLGLRKVWHYQAWHMSPPKWAVVRLCGDTLVPQAAVYLFFGSKPKPLIVIVPITSSWHHASLVGIQMKTGIVPGS